MSAPCKTENQRGELNGANPFDYLKNFLERLAGRHDLRLRNLMDLTLPKRIDCGQAWVAPSNGSQGLTEFRSQWRFWLRRGKVSPGIDTIAGTARKRAHAPRRKCNFPSSSTLRLYSTPH
jgi:hypothetical protein